MAIMTFNRAQGENLFKAALERMKPIKVVKDDGAYAMVFGDDKGGSENVVEYQRKYNPELNEPDILFDRCACDFGYDDFVEDIYDPNDPSDKVLMEKVLKNQKWRQFRIHVAKTQLKTSFK